MLSAASLLRDGSYLTTTHSTSEVQERQPVNTTSSSHTVLVWPPPPSPSPRGPDLQPFEVPSLNYSYPLCPWIRNGDGSTYARVSSEGPKPFPPATDACVNKMRKWASEGRLIVSMDMGALLGAVTAGGQDVGVDDLDTWTVYDEGLVSNVAEICPGVPWGEYGVEEGNLPRRSSVSPEEYRRAFVAFADTMCTCEFGGPFTCHKSSLDDEPRTKTLIVHKPEWGDTWEGRHVLTPPGRLDNPRGSAFLSVKYLYPGYWVPPTSGGKDMSNHRIYHYANPDHPLYEFPGWMDDTVKWCKVMSPRSDGSSLTLMELFSYVDLQIQQTKLNPSWIYRMLQEEPCLFLNTFDQLKLACSYLGRVSVTRGNRTAEKILYEEFQGVPLRLGSSSQPSCLLTLISQCESSTTAICGMLPTPMTS